MIRRTSLVFILLLTIACAAFPLPQLPGGLRGFTSTPEVTLPPLPAGSPPPTFTPSASFTVLTHPDGSLYVGDKVSFEVLSPSDFQLGHQKMRVAIGDQMLGETDFSNFGIAGRSEAIFYWAWNTQKLDAGAHTLTFSVLPTGPTWTETFTLLPAAGLPAAERDARWVSVSSACCTIYYISGTDAARDIEKLETLADAQAADVERRLGVDFKGKIPLTFLSRVLGQGGFTADAIYVSYLDHNYAGSTVAQVVHHEMVHWLDKQMGGDESISLLQEGLAVYFSDGHFKVEPILPRAAALFQLDWYIPLRTLVDSFYTSQHEISYIEAAALTAYMVQTYGWKNYNAFYRDLHSGKGGSTIDMLDAALQAHFNITFDQLEKDFIAFLHKQTVTPDTITDVRLSVAFYDAVRRYQQQVDTSAYFMTAWLPDGAEMRQQHIVDDYLRHPVSATGTQIEKLLVAGDASLRAGDYPAVEADIREVNRLLDELAGQSEK